MRTERHVFATPDAAYWWLSGYLEATDDPQVDAYVDRLDPCSVVVEFGREEGDYRELLWREDRPGVVRPRDASLN